MPRQEIKYEGPWDAIGRELVERKKRAERAKARREAVNPVNILRKIKTLF